MDDMDDLFPGVENRRDRSKKEKKSGIGDFFKIHSNNNTANLMGMFGGSNNDDNKFTDNNEEDIKNTKTSKKTDEFVPNNKKSIAVPEETSNNEYFGRRKSRMTENRVTDTPGFSNDNSTEKKKETVSMEPVKRIEEKNKYIKEDEEEDIGGYFPSRRNNKSSNKEDVNKKVKFEVKGESSTPISNENIQYKNILKNHKLHTSPILRDDRSDNSGERDRDTSPNYNNNKETQKSGDWDSNERKETVIINKGNENNAKASYQSHSNNNLLHKSALDQSPMQNDQYNTELFKLKIEKENVEKSLNDIKSRYEDEKKRLQENIKEEKEKNKKKDEEYSKFIEDLRERHRSEMRMIEESHKKNLENLSEDNNRLRKEIDIAINNERERLTMLHNSDLENKENVMKRALEDQKRFFEEQNNTLKMTIQQNIEFNKLASKLEISSKQVEDMVKKFVDEKEKLTKSEKESTIDKEKYLNEYDEKLKNFEKSLNSEKEMLTNMRRELDIKESEKKKEFMQERAKLDLESKRLYELQNTLKILEYNSKEKFDKDKLELEHKVQELKMETDALKSEYHQKLSDVEYQRKMLQEERNFFEKYKDEAMKNIDFKKNGLEEKKKQFVDEEREINARRKALQEQDYYIKEKFEELDKLKKEVFNEQRKVENDKKEVLASVTKFKEQLKNFEDKSLILDKEKEQIYKKYQELESERAFISNEKLKIEQNKTELRLRMQSMDALRIKYVSSNADNLGINSMSNTNHLMSLSMTNSFKPHNPIDKGVMSNNYISAQKESFIKVNTDNLNKTYNNARKSFNCDEYLHSLRAKLGDSATKMNHDNHFNDYIFKEKEYLKKSVTVNNAPEKDFNFEIKKEIEKINYNNKSVVLQNDFYMKPLENQHKNNFMNGTNNKSFLNRNLDDERPTFDIRNNNEMRPNFDISDTKQHFNQMFNDHVNKSISQEKRDNPPNINLSTSENQNQEKRNVEKPIITPPNLHYSKIKIEKLDDNSKSLVNESQHNEKIKKLVMDDEFDI